MREWLGRLIYATVSVLLPLSILVASAFLNFGGIILIIGLTVWIGFSLVILSPFIE